MIRLLKKYLDKWKNRGKVVTSFKYLGVETGRFSGREPNLQNIRPPGVNYTLRDEFRRMYE